MSDVEDPQDNAEFKATISFKDKSLIGAIAYIGTLGLAGGKTDPFAETRGGSTAAVLPDPKPGSPSHDGPS